MDACECMVSRLEQNDGRRGDHLKESNSGRAARFHDVVFMSALIGVAGVLHDGELPLIKRATGAQKQTYAVSHSRQRGQPPLRIPGAPVPAAPPSGCLARRAPCPDERCTWLEACWIKAGLSMDAALQAVRALSQVL